LVPNEVEKASKKGVGKSHREVKEVMGARFTPVMCLAVEKSSRIARR